MRILLIAMSGIRACDPELLRLGLTLPGFVERSKTIASLPSLGLLTLAGMTPREHDVRYVEVLDIKTAPALPMDVDLVAISSLSAQVKEAYALAERYSSAGVAVVMGGLHITTCPHEPARHGASAAIGEGEIIWPEILADAARGRLKPIYDARGRDFDLANSPVPRFDLLDIEKYNRLTVQTSRGCPWKCAFCASSILLTRKYKQKPIERVLAEVDAIRKIWPRPFIEFADDNGFVNRKYWRQLLPELAKRRIKWFTETDIRIADDPELVHMARKAGCAEVLIGFESPIKEGLDGIELVKNFKLTKYQQYVEAVRTIQSAGVRVNACFVLGLDGQGPEAFAAVEEFAREAMPYDIQVTVQTAFPGTPLYARLRSEGRIIEDEAWEKCTLFDVNYRPTHMSADELAERFRRLVVPLYSDEATQARREGFRRMWRGTPRRPKRAAA